MFFGARVNRGKMSEVSQWYSEKHILITGATGFMGKILIEKLLRSCQNIQKIYLLIRHKRGKSPKQRVEDLINIPIFEKLRASSNAEELFKKLQPICGDITSEGLGISPEDLRRLQENVDVVFHMAANVRFDQPLKQAMTFNTGGTLRLLEIVETFQELKAFVHVGTSYCHCDETVLEEKLYPAPHNPRKILDLVSWMDDDLVALLTPHLLKNSPNTYAYTKCLTEDLVKEFSKKIPIAIARPSIVIAAVKEPIPGWVDNLNGPTGILVGAGKGVIRTMHCNASLDADIVPVDIVINRLIVIAKELGQRKDLERPLVYNLTNDAQNPITWGRALDLGRKHFYNNPFSIFLWYPGGSIKSNYFLHMLAVFFFHLIPAYFVDGMLTLIGKKPFLIRTQKRIQGGLQVLQYYTTKPWRFISENIKDITDNLSKEDKEIFNTDMRDLDWDAYLLAYVLGARRYCVNDDPATIPKARKLLQRMYALHVVAHVGFILLICWICYINLEWLVSGVHSLLSLLS
ncbi:hypothetical protein Trydic_g2373 [Trypoxylus dichotomus]